MLPTPPPNSYFELSPLTTSDLLMIVYVIATIILVIVTYKTSVVNSSILRQAYQPKIVVYLSDVYSNKNPDIAIIVKNVGNGVARKLSFNLRYNPDLIKTFYAPEYLSEIIENGKNTDIPLLLIGIFQITTPNFSPGEQYSFSAGEVIPDILSIPPIEVTANYESDDGKHYHDTYTLLFHRYARG
jgi:hypothetical protein